MISYVNMHAKKRRLERETERLGVLNDTLTRLTITPSIYISIPSNYPFDRPTMYVHGKEHVTMMTRQFSKYKSFIGKYNLSVPCFCCSTLTCNWSPCNTCEQIYNEYIDYVTRLKEVASIKLAFDSCPFDDLVLSKIAHFL